MLLAIDAGNTTLSMGVYKKDKLLFAVPIAMPHDKTAVSLAVDLRGIFGLYQTDYTEMSGAIISCVVPSFSSVLSEAIRIFCGITPLFIGPGVKNGLNIKIDNPAQVGADMVAMAVGATARYKLPCVIYDLGTATTVSVISKDGVFMGGMIYPGVHISLQALENRTAQLPHIAIETPDSLIGTNTVDAMKSGIVYGTASVIDGLAERIELQLGTPCTHIATGSLSGSIYKYCKNEIIHDPSLIFEGLRIIYNKNK